MSAAEQRPYQNRHRWQSNMGHSYHSGPQYWTCLKCGLLKVTEYEEKPTYTMVGRGDGRTWYRFAPPCPPGEPR